MPDSAPSPSRPASTATQRVVLLRSPRSWGYALWKFSRPHTIVGTSLSVGGIFAIALHPQRLETGSPLELMIILVVAWIACLMGNLYIVGLNQLEDVEIDRINKPHLPLASGEFNHQDGRWIVGLAGGLGLGLAACGGPWLLAVVVTSLAIGTAYSLPPVRLKRFPFWASACILVVRGGIVNLGVYLHFRDRLNPGADLAIPSTIWALTSFIVLFSVAIALFKDIPDIEGDRRYNISTLSVTLGQRAVFNLARGILTLCYGGMVLASPWIDEVNQPFLALSHLGAITLFWVLSLRVHQFESGLTSQPVISYPAFYQVIWKLFFLEYLIFPLACWLA